ncbi:arsenite efflux transporter metallochaperone ArsD [Desertibacillus haloalkaliphilus]|uniref:arsenite efflux transporter metallochaperone ArsD n=1 Tax=Desertibacillus haloalkaliphilus TaxID=1328930 RepID=UPI001C26FC1B|nr:arsenite efflux transporter metallochaperone ArsD [Desertibacillus haloalkaliphilus]MBU8906661.1 arsenite efflux transporter metallochaperone ArsD [Desertibacillus haloalkaliphilus]
MVKIEIFDPAMCCPTGVCGPSVDPELARVATALFLLEKKGFDITRYNLGSEPDAFVENETVQALLEEKGTEGLPAVLVNGEVKYAGQYPTNEELASWCNIDVSELSKKEESSNIKLL